MLADRPFFSLEKSKFWIFHKCAILQYLPADSGVFEMLLRLDRAHGGLDEAPERPSWLPGS